MTIGVPSQVVLNGSVGLLTSRQMMAAFGKYFTVNTPSPGTGVAYAQLTSWSATANGLLIVKNTNPTGGPNIYFDRLELFQTATVATGTAIHFEVYNEVGIVTGTGAVAAATPVQLNQSGTQSTGAVVQAFSAGAITIPAAVGNRVLQGQAWLPTGVNVVKDTYVVDFGADGVATNKTGLTAVRSVDTGRHTTQMNPIVVAPGTTSWINCWGLGTSTPSFETNFTFIEL